MAQEQRRATPDNCTSVCCCSDGCRTRVRQIRKFSLERSGIEASIQCLYRDAGRPCACHIGPPKPVVTGASHTTLRPRELGPIEAKFLTDPAHVARIEILARAAKRRLRCSPFAVNRHHDMTLAPFLMLMAVEAAALLGKPLSECRSFHKYSPILQLDCLLAWKCTREIRSRWEAFGRFL